jgi:hypothetical protein
LSSRIENGGDKNLYIRLYNRQNAVNYALQWALRRNPQFYDYSNLGGDCSNFASQVIYAGAGAMNYTPIYGWYYKNPNQKSPSWTGVNYLYQFLINNHSQGPFATEIAIADIQLGDLIQLAFMNPQHFNHSLMVTKLELPITEDSIYVSTHSPDALNKQLSSYRSYHWIAIRFIHIQGVR